MRNAWILLGRGLLVSSVVMAAGGTVVACFDDYRVGDVATDAATTGPDSATTSPPDGGSSTNDAATDAPPTGNDAEAGPPPTFCDGVIPPANVVNFLCADFDSLVLGKGWDDVTRLNGGTIDKNNAVAFSPPSSMVANALGTGSNGSLTWKKVGAQRFVEATALFQINPGILGGVVPPSQGTLDLVHITTTNASVTLGLSRGATFEGAAYFGYFMGTAAFGGAAALTNYKIPTAIDANVWTEVRITWEAGGKLNVFFGGQNVLGVAAYASNDTSVTFRVGAVARGNMGAMPVHRFDNVQLGIRR